MPSQHRKSAMSARIRGRQCLTKRVHMKSWQWRWRRFLLHCILILLASAKKTHVIECQAHLPYSQINLKLNPHQQTYICLRNQSYLCKDLISVCFSLQFVTKNKRRRKQLAKKNCLVPKTLNGRSIKVQKQIKLKTLMRRSLPSAAH